MLCPLWDPIVFTNLYVRYSKYDYNFVVMIKCCNFEISVIVKKTVKLQYKIILLLI